MIPMTLNLFLVTLIGVHIIFMSGYIFGKLVDGNIVSNDEGQGSSNPSSVRVATGPQLSFFKPPDEPFKFDGP